MNFKKKKLTELELIKKRIGEINTEKSKLNDELEKLRNKCPHIKKEIGYLINNYGDYNISMICVDCGKLLGPLTEIDIKN
jgi:predicted nuclease with TOPRIM domain